jgi:phosphoglycolate phosphatase-like HAD superfamily hydrolase
VSRRKLLLFDIDNTLVNSRGAGRLALVRAAQAVYGTPGTMELVPLAGSTDKLAVYQAMQAVGMATTDIEAGWADFCRAAPQFLTAAIAERPVIACPGAQALLQQLARSVQHNGTLLGLVTGNLATTAVIKLAAAGIDPTQFRVGAYGSDAADRNELPALAVARALELVQHHFAGPDVVVIGDTPADVACGKVIGARTVGVATGPYRVDALATAGADVVLPDLQDTPAVLAVLVDH